MPVIWHLLNAPNAPGKSPTKPPHAPIAGHPVNGQAVTTIQRTHKKWKAYKLVGAALILIGFLTALHGGAYIGLGILLFISGLSASMIGKIGAWWP